MCGHYISWGFIITHTPTDTHRERERDSNDWRAWSKFCTLLWHVKENQGLHINAAWNTAWKWRLKTPWCLFLKRYAVFRQDDCFACNDYPCVRLGNHRLIKSCHLLLRDMTDYTLLLDQSCFYDVHDVTRKREPDFYEKIVTVCMIPAVLCSSILKVSTSGTSFLFFLGNV